MNMTPEEEQARDFFAAVGLAIYRAVLLEARLASHLAFPEGKKKSTPEEVAEARRMYRRLPLGHLVNHLRKREGVDLELLKVLDERVKDRRLLAHHLLWDRAEDMVTQEGRENLKRELTAMGERFLDANKMVRRASVEWAKARGFTEPEIEKTLRRERQKRGLPPDLPPHLR